jgi:protein-S-isoprenylcysteine O-methyltransferase Ste14
MPTSHASTFIMRRRRECRGAVEPSDTDGEVLVTLFLRRQPRWSTPKLSSVAGLLAEFAVFVVLAVVVVSLLDTERDGDDVSGFVTMGMWFAYLVHADTVTSAAYIDTGRVPLPRLPMLVVGLTIVAAGLVLFAWAARALVRDGSFAGATSTRLVTTGPYAHVRHPQDLGWGLMLLGVAVAGGSLIALALVAVFAIFVSRVWRADDRQLLRRFGDAYARYRASTPAVAPWRRPRAGFSVP